MALTATGTGLLWYTAATGGTGSPSAPFPSTAVAGNISYYVSQTNGTCGEGPRVPIVVTTYPIPPAPTVGPDPVYCVNSGTPASALSATGSNLLWYTSSIGGIGSNIPPIPSINTVGSIPYYVSQTINTCESPRSVINVNTTPAPSLGPDQTDTVCFGESIDLTTYYNTTGLTVHWLNNGVEVTDPTNISNSGTYELQVFLGDCSDTAFLFFNVRPPVIANAGNDTIAVRGIEHQLFATGGLSYIWSPSTLLNFSNTQNPLATLNDDQLFVVTAYNSIGCFDKDSVFIKVYDGPTYYIPNAFSPDGDGLNDVFRPIPVGIINTEYFRIYNRLGKLIYNSSRWLHGWDGTYQGRKQLIGNYVWVIRGTDRDGKVIEMKGNVLLLK
jgi:gliding motility-associated-like protein